MAHRSSTFGAAATACGLWLAAAAGAAPAVAPPAPAAPATVFSGGPIYTAAAGSPYAQAVAIRGDRILAVGSLAEVERRAGKGALHVDLHGRFLMPGLIDAHAHPIQAGLGLLLPRFEDPWVDAATLGVAVDRFAAAGDRLHGDVLVVDGLDLSNWAHAAEIEALLSDAAHAARPIVLLGNDAHTAWANRAARERAGITRDFLRQLPDAERRYYGSSEALEPNGFVVDGGRTRIEKSLPPFSAEALLRGGQVAVQGMNALGITGWLDAEAAGVVGGDIPLRADEPGYLPVYRELARRGELTVHVAAYPVVKPSEGVAQLAVIEALRREFAGITDLAIPGPKIFADGVVEFPSQTAALSKPYRNSGQQVPMPFTARQMDELVVAAAQRGMAVHVHAIGDLAVHASLDAFAAARKAAPANRAPYALTHAQFVDAADVPRFARLGVFPVLQLFWAKREPDSVESVEPYVDPAIYATMYPARSLLDAGARVAGGSDWPVSTPNPFQAMAVAEQREGSEGVLDAAQRMPREAMLRAYTRHAAEVLGRASEIGTIEPGKRADLVLVDRDLLVVPAGELGAAQVVWTMFGGRVVHGATEYAAR